MKLSDPYWSRDAVILERTRERDDARAIAEQRQTTVVDFMTRHACCCDWCMRLKPPDALPWAKDD